MNSTPSHISSAIDDLKRLASRCETDAQRLKVARFGLAVLLRSPHDLLVLLAEHPQWLESLGVRIVPSKTADLEIDELIELRRSE